MMIRLAVFLISSSKEQMTRDLFLFSFIESFFGNILFQIVWITYITTVLLDTVRYIKNVKCAENSMLSMYIVQYSTVFIEYCI